jgi:hypothetical protein
MTLSQVAMWEGVLRYWVLRCNQESFECLGPAGRAHVAMYLEAS